MTTKIVMKATSDMTLDELKEKLENSVRYQEQYILESGKRSRIHDRRIKSLTAEIERR